MNSTLRHNRFALCITIAMVSLLSCGRGNTPDSTLAPEANPFSPPSASSNVVPDGEISRFIARTSEMVIATESFYIMQELWLNSTIRKVFEDQGITLESEFVVDEADLTVTLDGYNPDSRIGYVIAGARATDYAFNFPDSTLYSPEYTKGAIHEAQLRALGSSSAAFRAPVESLLSKFPDETSLKNHVSGLPNGAERWRKSRRTAIIEVIRDYHNSRPLSRRCLEQDLPQYDEDETSEEQLLATLESSRNILIECEKALLGRADMIELERRARDGAAFVAVVSLLDPRWCGHQDDADSIKAENALRQTTLDFITWARSQSTR